LGRKIDPLSQQVTDPPEEKTLLPVSEPVARPVRKVPTRLSKMSIIAFFVLIGLSLLLFSDQIISGLVQTNTASAVQATPTVQVQSSVTTQGVASQTPTVRSTRTPVPVSPFFTPNNGPAPALTLPGGYEVLYQSMTHLFLVSTSDKSVQGIYTPGYNYNQAVHPILTPDGRLLYSGGRGIWLTNIFDPRPVQLAQFNTNTVLTSLALSQDEATLAWSTEPADGNGQTSIYAGPLDNPQLIWQQSTQECPCFHIFSFLNGGQASTDTILLLTDDRGSSESVQYGLWELDITNLSDGPRLILDENSQQGPLTLAPSNRALLYSTYEGSVPVPTDGSVPADTAGLSYADSLCVTTLSIPPVAQHDAQVILPEQHNLSNSAQYHWVTTPVFSPNGDTLAYVEFSSDSQPPYDRYSALYTVSINSSGGQLEVNKPQLVAVSTAGLLELGPWLNSDMVTVYGDSVIYVFDVQDGSLAILNHSSEYLRILGIIDSNQTEGT
jgi:hypothetical protein